MAVVVLKKRNIRVLVITVLLLGLTFTVLRSTGSAWIPSSRGEYSIISGKQSSNEQDLVNYGSVEQQQQQQQPTEQEQQVAEVDVDAPVITPDSIIKENNPKSHSFDPKEEFDRLIRSAPVVMFSKTYCPFSRALKDLLFKNFEINPQIVIVELDEYPNGQKLQEYIGEKTGRKTVPNLMVNGQSRGGFDDLNALFESSTLFNDLTTWSDNKFTIKQKTTS